MSHTPSSAPRALGATEALLLKARNFVDYLASCGNDDARVLVGEIDAHLSAPPRHAVDESALGVEGAWVPAWR